MERNHHNACRCNDCVRRRNSHRQHFVEQRSRGSTSPAPNATLYEVPGDHPVAYEDDIRQSGGERPRDRVAVRTDPDGSGRVANSQRDDATGRPGSLPGRAERQIDQPPEDVDGGPAPQRDEIDFQQEGTVRLDSELLTQERELVPPPEDGDITTFAEYPGSENVAVTPGMAGRHRNRRRFVLPLILAVLLVTAIIGAGVLAVVLLAPSQETSTAETVEPTRDLGTTVAAAAMAVAAQNPAQANPTNDGEETAPATVQPRSEGVPQIPPSQETSTAETVQPSPDLDATVAAAAAMAVAAQNPAQANPTNDGEETAPATVQPRSEGVPQIPPWLTMLSEYVNWEQTPEISATGKLVFKAKIDEGAHFVAAGDHCGFANVSLTDNANVSYGSVIPRSMSIPCGAGPGDWVSTQYYYTGNLLTVTVQLSSEIAAHPGLMLCLWTGGATDEENRLLDCVPVRQP